MYRKNSLFFLLSSHFCNAQVYTIAFSKFNQFVLLSGLGFVFGFFYLFVYSRE